MSSEPPLSASTKPFSSTAAQINTTLEIMSLPISDEKKLQAIQVLANDD